MKKFNVVKNFKYFAAIAIIMALTGVVALVGAPFGLNLFNLDIDFVGGTTMYYSLNKAVSADDIATVHDIVKEVTGEKASSVVTAGAGDEIIVKTKDIDTEARDAIFAKLSEKFNLTQDNMLNVDNVNPSVGKDLRTAAFKAALVAVLLMLLYITVRFDFRSGLSAVICLMHDVLVMMSFCVIFRIPININFIAAVLIIFGYSINASIVTFDRIRENHKLSSRKPIDEVVEMSIWQTMTRTLNTTLTTLFTIVALFILGVPSIRTFALPIIVGIVSGAFSSAFLAGPIWAKMKDTKKA